MFHRRNSSQPWLFTLRFSILAIFIGLIILITFSIILLRSWTFSNELTYSSFQTMQYAAAAIQHQVTASVRPAHIEGQLAMRLVKNKLLSDDVNNMAPYTFLIAQGMPLAQRVYWANENGDYIYSLKQSDGSIFTGIYDRSKNPPTLTELRRDKAGNVIDKKISTELNFDPRSSAWYQQAKKRQHFYWTDVQVFLPNPHVGLGAISPLSNEAGKFIGVFGINISLTNLSQFMTNLHVSEHGFAFIITPQGDLVAYPNKEPFIALKDKKDDLINVHTTLFPLIDQSFDIYKQKNESNFTVDFNNETYLVTYLPVADFYEKGWLIGVMTPRNDFIGALRNMNLLTLAISMIVLLLGIFLVSKLVSRVVRPFQLLSRETQKIKHFNLNGDIQVQSRIKEVVSLTDAIRSMKFGLKSFQKYVPHALVKQLIESGEDIRVGGVRKKLVVFFSDIQNFTSIAETVDASQLTIQLCEYFEELTKIIIQEKGTIDKYIGDSIMAFWGAPLHVPHAAELAARTALRCEARLDKLNANWEKEGKPRFVTRIGIHAGEAIVGNLGSTERLNYTALGDSINTASRLEEINKDYKTRIMVSESVYEKISDKFTLRFVDHVAVKGKSHIINIYELLGDKDVQLTFDLPAYDKAFKQAFTAYKNKEWDKANDYFHQCQQIYPDDSLAPIFLKRIEEEKNQRS